MNQKITCVALDFDDTLVSIEGQTELLIKLCESYGVPKEEAEKCYSEIYYEPGFSFSGMRAQLEKHGYEIDEKFVEKLWKLRKEVLKPFPDVQNFLETYKNIPMTIVTGGEPIFQKEKIKIAGFSEIPCIVTRVGEKTEAIKSLLTKYGAPILFLDDKTKEFDNLQKDGITSEQVKMILVDRLGKNKDNGKYETITSFEDEKLKTLLEV